MESCCSMGVKFQLKFKNFRDLLYNIVLTVYCSLKNLKGARTLESGQLGPKSCLLGGFGQVT